MLCLTPGALQRCSAALLLCDTSADAWCAVRQYHNIFALVRELGIPWPFTPWSQSGFWSPRGLAIEASQPAPRGFAHRCAGAGLVPPLSRVCLLLRGTSQCFCKRLAGIASV